MSRWCVSHQRREGAQHGVLAKTSLDLLQAYCSARGWPSIAVGQRSAWLKPQRHQARAGAGSRAAT